MGQGAPLECSPRTIGLCSRQQLQALRYQGLDPVKDKPVHEQNQFGEGDEV